MSGDGFSDRVEQFTPSQAEDSIYWKAAGLDVAFLVTWMSMIPVLRALREARTRIVNFGDTDGLVGYRTNPLATLRRMIVYHKDWLTKLRCIKYWLQKLAFEAPAADAEIVHNLELSDLTLVSNPESRRLFGLFLARKGYLNLFSRTLALPPPVHEDFCSAEVPAKKAPLFTAIGRWNDPAKNVGLLAAGLDRYYRRGGTTEVVVVGPGGEEAFAPLTARFPKLQYLGFQPREAIVNLLRTACGIIFSSHWEGGPNAANEMLALGGTVMGPPLPALIGIVEGGRFGQIARSRRPGDLATAIATEAAQWETGSRDPRAISAHWRQRLNPVQVCEKLIAALQARADLVPS